MNNELKSEHDFKKLGRLDQLMFRSFEQPSSENMEIEETYEEIEYEHSNRRNGHSRLDSLMLGERHHPSPKGNNNDRSLSNQLNDVVNNINFFELMENIDTLVSSAKQLKPLYRQVTPLIDQFFKKKD
ncbi:hypothetical protein [Bacillus sp. FJAT-29937]|uniref:hypothetical protein n=1 Tax=Bacillus sp. FJAT-29937 TaxID=1720553 RepID=UPI000832B62E|nr:hypothetical protein [Bacillus sp. FJAT-29937]